MPNEGLLFECFKIDCFFDSFMASFLMNLIFCDLNGPICKESPCEITNNISVMIISKETN